MSREPSVRILSATADSGRNPFGPGTAVVKLVIDLTRPADLARDFARAIKNHRSIPLPRKACDPRILKAVNLVLHDGLSYREASRRVFTTAKRKDAIMRKVHAILNAARTACS